MQILKKKKILSINNLDNYEIYLKNLNFLNKLKKKEKILLKDVFLLKLKEFYLINLNLKENYFFKNLNLNYEKKYFLYNIKNINNEIKKNILININFINYFILNLYTYILFKKFKKYEIKKFYIKKKINQEILYKKKNKIYFFFKGRIIYYKGLKNKKNLNKIDKKYLFISFYSLIKQVNFSCLYNKKKNSYFIKNPYLRRRYKKKKHLKNIFKKHFKKLKNFKIENTNNKNIKFIPSRKAYIFDFNNNKIKNNYKLYNFLFLKKYYKIFIEK